MWSVVCHVVTDSGGHKIGFFEPAYAALPAGLAGVVFMGLFALCILPRKTELFTTAKNKATDLLTEVQISSGHALVGKPVALLMAKLQVRCERCFLV